MSHVDRQIERAMFALTELSNTAKAEEDEIAMYAANRAWRELFDAQKNRVKARLTVVVSNGERGGAA